MSCVSGFSRRILSHTRDNPMIPWARIAMRIPLWIQENTAGLGKTRGRLDVEGVTASNHGCDSRQFRPEWAEQIEAQCIGSVREGALRRFVYFNEHGVDSGGHGGTRQRLDKLRLAARCGSRRAGELH